MRRVLFMLLDAGVAAVILLPFFIYLNRRLVHSWKRSFSYFLFAVYLSGVYAVVGLPDICYLRLEFNINLIPFAYMFSDYLNSLLNVLLFIPLGFFLPVLWKRFSAFPPVALCGLGMSALIEVLQIFTFRATDINDLITNTFGTVLGWCAGRLALRLFPTIHPDDRTGHLYLTFGLSFCVMFFVQPLVANLLF